MSFTLILVVLLSSSGEGEWKLVGPDTLKEFESLHTADHVEVDAELDEPDWARASALRFQDDTFRNFPLKNENSVEVRSLWDESSLYFAFRVYDKDLQAIYTTHEHPDLSSDDIVEFLIDTSNGKEPCWNEHSVIYHINLHGKRKTDRGSDACVPDGVWHGNGDHAVQVFGTVNDDRDVDQGYIVEVAVSWEELGIQPVPGLRLGANFANAERRIFFDWAGARPFRSPDAFGDLVLVK